MSKYTAKLHIGVQPEEDNLGIKTGIESGRLPQEVASVLSELLIKIPILIRAGWLAIRLKMALTLHLVLILRKMKTMIGMFQAILIIRIK
ncbi:Uncharacterised protein [[Actinobacillus] rossii]|uniref:Uncharacterized protein n=1 Tax=[Actinobacillus] rossii TaxID=123820 RepID=A0A380U0W2_9PAST|nr:Uncharacterised protein [[Actinobacillus] rossii]